MPLNDDETQLVGKWVSVGGKVEADETAQRIDYLVESELIKVGPSKDGWDILFVDGCDHRYWELSYPQKELHGGGPPMLTRIEEEKVKFKYKHLPEIVK